MPGQILRYRGTTLCQGTFRYAEAHRLTKAPLLKETKTRLNNLFTEWIQSKYKTKFRAGGRANRNSPHIATMLTGQGTFRRMDIEAAFTCP
jgi:hypothetical protein